MKSSVLSSVSSPFDDDNMEESSDLLRINNCTSSVCPSSRDDASSNGVGLDDSSNGVGLDNRALGLSSALSEFRTPSTCAWPCCQKGSIENGTIAL